MWYVQCSYDGCRATEGVQEFLVYGCLLALCEEHRQPVFDRIMASYIQAIEASKNPPDDGEDMALVINL